MSAFVPLTDSVQVRFVASDYDPQALVEAAVDAFEVNRIDCTPPCLVDIAPSGGDGLVDVSDLLALLASWGECPADEPCPADLNGDGVVDVSDLLDLLGNWGACRE